MGEENFSISKTFDLMNNVMGNEFPDLSINDIEDVNSLDMQNSDPDLYNVLKSWNLERVYDHLRSKFF